jgi:TonB family protein
VIGRHTFFDFGPPFHFYEILSIRSGEGALSVERLTVTPPGQPCVQPPTVEIASATVAISMSDLLGGRSPCAIPEKELRREIKRCKKCLVFSGADVTMQVRCGDRIRRIRMDILDRDMFDPAPRTPAHTSWTMALLQRLDQALGNGVMDRPMFQVESTGALAAEIASAHAKSLDALRLGTFDALFANAPDKPSELYAESLKPPVIPTVALRETHAIQPISYSLPKYPPIARLARIDGDVALSVTVAADGTVSKVAFVSGHPMLRLAVESEAAKWKFPAEAAGRKLDFVIAFRTNCPTAQR